ncbi:hypothetical protein ACFU99_20830 [Streptomyces sp. NPDC057654]|uniref:hypothetical protein n=1 Tax=Streptomyces sp. NPDC057654 TaxID=3346196 RepID=UPI0036A64353
MRLGTARTAGTATTVSTASTARSASGGPVGRTGTGAPRRAAKASALGLAALLLAGCGIRGTSVPVDAGSAPSRATCVVRAGGGESAPDDGQAVSVYLVCASQLLPVTRTVRLPEGDAAEDPVRVAGALLEQLRQPPLASEEEAGFSTDVPAGLSVSGPREHDPSAALRLSRSPEELPPSALGQLVCTFAGTAAADGGRGVLLGGPDDNKPRRYECTDEMRSRPQSAPTGAPVAS